MTIEPDSSTTQATGIRPVLHGAAALVGATLLLGGLLLLVDAEEEQRDTTAPARAALGDAALFLSQTYSESQALADKLREVHQQLARALALLDRAEHLDPGDRQKIDALRRQLQDLEDTGQVLITDPEAMKRTYHDLTTRLNALQQRLERPRS